MTEVTKEKKPVKKGVGQVARDAIRAGKTNEEALEIVQKHFPDANTSIASIAWYRNDLRQQGEDVPTAREVKKSRMPEKPAAEKKKAAAEKK